MKRINNNTLYSYNKYFTSKYFIAEDLGSKLLFNKNIDSYF